MSLVILLGRMLYQKVATKVIYESCILAIDMIMRVKYGKKKK